MKRFWTKVDKAIAAPCWMCRQLEVEFRVSTGTIANVIFGRTFVEVHA